MHAGVFLNGDCNFAGLNNECNAKGEIIIIREQAEKSGTSGIRPWATHNLGKCTRIQCLF